MGDVGDGPPRVGGIIRVDLADIIGPSRKERTSMPDSERLRPRTVLYLNGVPRAFVRETVEEVAELLEDAGTPGWRT